MHGTRISWRMLPIVLTAQALCPATVNVEQVTYNGWRGAWRIHNDKCEIVIVPQVGRVMSFARVGGKNVLWNNDAIQGQTVLRDDHEWHNFGGDKVWPTQQDWWERYTDRKGWPPPYFSDAAPQTAEPIEGGVRMTSPKSPEFGTRTIREFVMDPDKPLVYVRQWFKKEDGMPVAMTFWTVTQVRTPDYALLPSSPVIDGRPYKALGEVVPSRLKIGDGCVSIRNDAQKPQKIGTAAAGQSDWVAAVFGDELFIESRRVGTVKAEYPDGNSQGEIYTAPVRDGSYVELELLSPLRDLKPDETLRDDVVWQIVRLKHNAPEQAAAEARQAHAVAIPLMGQQR